MSTIIIKKLHEKSEIKELDELSFYYDSDCNFNNQNISLHSIFNAIRNNSTILMSDKDFDMLLNFNSIEKYELENDFSKRKIYTLYLSDLTLDEVKDKLKNDYKSYINLILLVKDKSGKINVFINNADEVIKFDLNLDEKIVKKLKFSNKPEEVINNIQISIQEKIKEKQMLDKIDSLVSSSEGDSYIVFKSNNGNILRIVSHFFNNQVQCFIEEVNRVYKELNLDEKMIDKNRDVCLKNIISIVEKDISFLKKEKNIIKEDKNLEKQVLLIEELVKEVKSMSNKYFSFIENLDAPDYESEIFIKAFEKYKKSSDEKKNVILSLRHVLNAFLGNMFYIKEKISVLNQEVLNHANEILKLQIIVKKNKSGGYFDTMDIFSNDGLTFEEKMELRKINYLRAENKIKLLKDEILFKVDEIKELEKKYIKNHEKLVSSNMINDFVKILKEANADDVDKEVEDLRKDGKI